MAKKRSHKLGQFFATSIAGNDILSSALYVSGIAALFAGVYAPIVLLAVALVLFVYRSVYREVVGALPLNGGAYNALLNGTSKAFAAVAGVMTILSYIATGVISATTAIAYLFQFLNRILPIYNINLSLAPWMMPAIALVLLGFALLVIIGVKDSAVVAAGIFVFHLLTLSVFAILGIFFIVTYGTGIWSANVVATADIVTAHGGLAKTLFLAFSASLLGVSGFESSANFVEEQKPGVFPKTLRNMAFGVLIFNPLLAAVALSILPLPQVIAAKDFLLADAALNIGGLFLMGWIAIDAFLVLCGAVLTSYVGVTGLIKRMSLDGCLPTSLTTPGKDASQTKIVITFFLLCVSILYVTKGDLLSLAGVYTISFLSVMTFFAASNLLLRVTRPELKRPYTAPFAFVIIALLSTFIGVMGNIAIDPKNTGYFLTYFLPAAALVFCVLERKRLYATLAHVTKKIRGLHVFFVRKLKEVSDEHIVVFVHHVDRLAVILDYIRRNETGQHVTLVHCRHGHKQRVHELEGLVEMMKHGGFFPNFRVSVEYIDKPFTPATVAEIGRRKRVPRNKIFIGSIHHEHEFNYEDFGGVRVIL